MAHELSDYEIENIKLRLGSKDNVTLTHDEATALMELWGGEDFEAKADRLEIELEATIETIADLEGKVANTENDTEECKDMLKDIADKIEHYLDEE